MGGRRWSTGPLRAAGSCWGATDGRCWRRLLHVDEAGVVLNFVQTIRDDVENLDGECSERGHLDARVYTWSC
jgi:hypothetical protein